MAYRHGEGVVRARAPLRLGLAGGGSDVSPFADQYGGAVLNATIDRYATASYRPRTDGLVELVSTDLGERETLSLTPELPLHSGLKLHRAVYNRMTRDYNDGRPLPMTLLSHVESPVGSGLGSSSALVVALVTLLAGVLGAPLGEYEIARLAFDIERKDLGLAGGRQDQYAATFGGFNFMEFAADERVIVNPLRIRQDTICELEASLVLLFTGASRESATIITDQARSVASGGKSLEAMLQLKAEAFEMKEAVLFGNIDDIAQVLRRGWEAKKSTSGSVSSPEIERIFGAASQAGALAGKVSGAGGGGFMMFIAQPERRADVIAALEAASGQRPTTARFTAQGTETWRPIFRTG